MENATNKLEQAKALVGKGKVSRREFIQLALLAGLTVSSADKLFVSAARAEGKRGGSARFGVAHGSTSDTLDPAHYYDTFAMTAFWGSLSNSLTEVDERGNVVGDLAESMEPSPDAKKWVFKLRPGLTFHNGKDVTAADVVASFRHHMGPNSKSAAAAFLEPIEGIKADGKNTVVFELKGGSADFPYIVSDCHLPIMPAKGNDAVDWQSGVRTGAFILDSVQPGVSTKLKRNPNYHKENRPFLDEVEFLALVDVAARMNALVTGDVDWIGRCDLNSLQLLQRNSNVEIDEVTGYGHYVYSMDTTIAPFDNADVRRALKYAIDREQINQKIFFKHADIGNDNPVAPTMKYAVNPEPVYKYDPDKAKFYLRKAGHENLKVSLSVADSMFTGAINAAVLYRDSALKAGIDINVVREADDGYFENVWRRRPWFASYWTGRPTCDFLFTLAYAKGAAWNETAWDNARFNELLPQARAELNEEKRAAMYAEMQQLVHDDGGVLVLAFYHYVTAHSKKLAHGPLSAGLENDGLRLAERWWRAD